MLSDEPYLELWSYAAAFMIGLISPTVFNPSFYVNSSVWGAGFLVCVWSVSLGVIARFILKLEG